MSVYWMLSLFVYLRGYWIWEHSAGDRFDMCSYTCRSWYRCVSSTAKCLLNFSLFYTSINHILVCTCLVALSTILVSTLLNTLVVPTELWKCRFSFLKTSLKDSSSLHISWPSSTPQAADSVWVLQWSIQRRSGLSNKQSYCVLCTPTTPRMGIQFHNTCTVGRVSLSCHNICISYPFSWRSHLFAVRCIICKSCFFFKLWIRGLILKKNLHSGLNVHTYSYA